MTSRIHAYRAYLARSILPYGNSQLYYYMLVAGLRAWQLELLSAALGRQIGFVITTPFGAELQI